MFGVLSDKTIKFEIQAGNIVFHDPDNDCSNNIQNCSIDVTLGENYYRNTEYLQLLNPWCKEHVDNYWKLQQADVIENFSQESRIRLKQGSKYILLNPGESILGHTREFIGGKNNITTMVKARSSLGRNNITVCRDAGWGDIGYCNRYTLEISNNGSSLVVLPVGARIAQIVFFYTDSTYNQYKGKYQETNDINELVKSWTPQMMLPKLYLEKCSFTV